MGPISNLTEFVEKFQDFEINEDSGTYVLRCTCCFRYISSPTCSKSAKRSKGGPTGSLATGLVISQQNYNRLIMGRCQKWFNQKSKLTQHMESDTHIQALTQRKVLF